ncbi:helix-turn-helix domain-containing protein [Cupriavidus sp. AcVe19-6a]|uniref:MarR family transcriptional regulator n=1 Tax=Cupriavidus sp. AcVe19-6a TaxID=2821358 RepID=UPI001AE8FE27|nr:helix-turn-helix domain-containing protein [Cupriavidus sp. AcVe19-6a]MBP0639567.1 hypothetical protein [Cupriavidus sp. AcVe19-6a]
MTAMTQAEFARRMGVSRPAVTQWKQRGLVVLEGNRVDVERSDAMLAKYRRLGLPDVQPGDHRVKRGRPTVNATINLAALLNAAKDAEPVTLTAVEIERRLRALDWRQTFDWSESACRQRARLAAMCVGFEAAESDLSDDGHWGGFQLRDPRGIAAGEMREDAVRAGYGFEASAAAVLEACRHEVALWDEDGADPSDADLLYQINPVLLSLLAYPHYPHQTAP